MSYLTETRTGPYLHSPRWHCTKTFDNGRCFIILIAQAVSENGYIKPGRNGVTVIDLDNEVLLLDEHLCQPISDISSPSEEQMTEYYAMLEMDSYSGFMLYLENQQRYIGPAIMNSLIQRGMSL